MAQEYAANDSEGILRQLRENGITDLDELARKLSESRAQRSDESTVLCNQNFCVIVLSTEL